MEVEPDEADATMTAEAAEEIPDKPRLMISKIVCTNFKSYAGLKELGPFHKVCDRLRGNEARVFTKI